MDIYLDKIINRDDIKDNSVLVFKFEHDGYQDFQKVANAAAKILNGTKDCFFLFLHKSQEFEIWSEEEMNKRGWYKKKE